MLITSMTPKEQMRRRQVAEGLGLGDRKHEQI
jgi:hypothetical protein